MAGFAKNCLLGRGLVECGVRFAQFFNGSYALGEGVGNGDRHKTLKEQYNAHRPIFDQSAAAWLKVLKGRGLLANTLVVWVTEFGRTPTCQKCANGRDHNPKGFTVWPMGAGESSSLRVVRRRIRVRRDFRFAFRPSSSILFLPEKFVI